MARLDLTPALDDLLVEPVNPYRQLWAGVLVQAVQEFGTYVQDMRYSKRALGEGGSRHAVGVDAFRWLFSPAKYRDFAWVCDVLDLEPTRVRSALAQRWGLFLPDVIRAASART